jgi:hypothetical protein
VRPLKSYFPGFGTDKYRLQKTTAVIIFTVSFLKTKYDPPMSTRLLPYRSVSDYSAWQLAARLVVLAGVLMAYSYCFLLTIKSIIKVFS